MKGLTTIEGDKKDFPNDLKIKGSKAMDDLIYLINFDDKKYKTIDSLQRIKDKLTIKEIERMRELGAKIKLQNETIIQMQRKYIRTYPDVVASADYVYYLTDDLPKDTIRMLYNTLTDNVKASKYGKVVNALVNNTILKSGENYFDFSALYKDGNTVQFSSLLGKYILLDFSSIFCGPYKQANIELKTLEQQYKDNLTIITFSADEKKSDWLRGIERDKITWLSLWDGNGELSETFIRYGGNGMPTFVLISPDGKIKTKWIGYSNGRLQQNFSFLNSENQVNQTNESVHIRHD
jgi:peroxiredoxin